MSNKEIELFILDLDLKKLEYETFDNKEIENKHVSLDIRYSIGENDKVSFYVTLELETPFIKSKFEYEFIMRIKNVEDMESFIEDEKEDLIYPVYNKAVLMIANLTEQSFPFPIVVANSSWLEDTDEE